MCVLVKLLLFNFLYRRSSNTITMQIYYNDLIMVAMNLYLINELRYPRERQHLLRIEGMTVYEIADT